MLELFSGLFVAALTVPPAVVAVMLFIVALTPRARTTTRFTPDTIEHRRVAA